MSHHGAQLLSTVARRIPRRAASNFTQSDLPACDFKPSKYTGRPPAELAARRKTLLHPVLFTLYKEPLFVHQGYMQYLYDGDNQRYLDLFGGICTVSAGHSHPVILERIKAQLDKLTHATTIYNHPSLVEFAEKLTSKLPEPLKVCYFVNSGSEANDLALFMARLYTGRFDIVSLRNAYHGMSPHLQNLTAMGGWRWPYPMASGHIHMMNPDVYRSPWGGARCRNGPTQTDRPCSCSEGQCTANDQYINELNSVLDHCTAKAGVAGFIAEPIQGAGGVVQYPKQFLTKAYEEIRKHGGVCISDEVQTGFGRLGSHYWGFEHAGVLPDIVTMAKSIANGIPMAAVITTSAIAEAMSGVLHFNTYGGNPVSCAAGSATLDVLDAENRQEHCQKLGTEYWIPELAKMKDEFECVGDVRGLGMMIGIELVEDKVSKKPISAEKSNMLLEKLKEKYVMIGKGGCYGNILRIKPPMCVTKEDVDYATAAFRESFKELGY